MPTRVLAALVLAAFLATFAALAFGEYELTGALPFVGGPLFGYLLAEIVVGVARERSAPIAVITGVLAAMTFVLAGYIDANDLEPIKVGAWLAAALAAAAAVARAGRWRAG